MAAAGSPLWQRLAVIVVAIVLVLWAERVLPYERQWNRDHGDTWRDVMYAGINTALNNAGIWLLPLFASLGVFSAYWPGDWPFWLQVVFAVVIQLLLQHSNVDYRTGPFKYVFANAEVHRFHHRKGAGLGDVNFGLFTMFWDNLLGTYFYAPERVSSDVLGIGDRLDYPRTYIAQLFEPLRRNSAVAEIYGTEE